ncbi:MAG TPA: winged helix DNA-binding domain-containing protein, partial [Bacteroidota bacterium]|nr:winged helix DNA-binding domain-containing protein [Bacteroidota bacterium]
YMSRFGITVKEFDALNDHVLELLRGGPMSQGELTKQLLPRAGRKMQRYMKVAWSIQLFRPALVEGFICYAAQRGSEATYVRVDQWLPKMKSVPELEAKKELVRQYLTAYGPATPQDFSRWAGIPMREVREAWEPLRDELVEVSVGEKQNSMLRKDLNGISKIKLRVPVLRLLPSFDPYMLGHEAKNHLIEDRQYKRVYRNQGWLSPVVLLNGKVIGIWSHKRRGEGLVLDITPFQKFSQTIRAKVEQEAASLGKFLETICRIRYGR